MHNILKKNYKSGFFFYMVLFLGDASLNQAGQQIDDFSLIIACCGKLRVSGLFKNDSVSLFVYAVVHRSLL